MEISASEIRILCRRISSSIVGYTVSSVYSIEGGILLRLRHEIKEEKFIAISSLATWITTKNISLEHADTFVSSIRERVERCRLVDTKQEGNERIVTFYLESRAGDKCNLHAEFFGGGNIIITDKDERIQFVRKSQHFRHRNLLIGDVYILPPTRGVSLEALDESYLLIELDKVRLDQRLQKMAAIRWFGRLVGTSRKFIEEIFFRSGIAPDLSISDVRSGEIAILATVSKDLASEIETSSKGFLLIPNSETEFEIDVSPIVPHSWKEKQEQDFALIRDFASFDLALDEAQAGVLLADRKAKASKEDRARAEELESAIRKQEALFQKNEKTARELRRIGTELISSISPHGLPEEIAIVLESMSLLHRDRYSNNELRFVNQPRTFLKTIATPQALASRLFDEAKNLEQTNRSINKVRANLISRKDTLLEQGRTIEVRATKRVAIERRSRQWFERYRWFLTSDRRLAIGGRDSTSNSIVINKYTDQNSIIFHADLHGSPFFVLKNGREDGLPHLDQETEQELAQATVSFSRAWKDELGSADAYWIEPDQIKKSAPSGEYLPRGSFFIEGKKNLVKHLRVELCVGMMGSDDLPRGSETDSSVEKLEIISPILVCGPEKALARYCISRVKLSPGKERGTLIGKKIKQTLISKIKEEKHSQFKELAKKISIDDIVRVLPSGSYKIVMEKQNG